jgi:hypothetical protein
VPLASFRLGYVLGAAAAAAGAAALLDDELDVLLVLLVDDVEDVEDELLEALLPPESELLEAPSFLVEL